MLKSLQIIAGPAGRPHEAAAGDSRLMQSGQDQMAVTASGLYDRHLREVYRFVSRRISRREDAEDVTAEVFEAGFQYLGRLRSADNPRVWLLGIARRKVVDYLRRNARRPELLDCDAPDGLLEFAVHPGDDPEFAVRREEARRTIRGVMAGLSEDHREALMLQYVEELSIAEVAAVMGRTLGATNSLLQRARAAAFRAGEQYFVDDKAIMENQHLNTRTQEQLNTEHPGIRKQTNEYRQPQ